MPCNEDAEGQALLSVSVFQRAFSVVRLLNAFVCFVTLIVFLASIGEKSLQKDKLWAVQWQAPGHTYFYFFSSALNPLDLFIRLHKILSFSVLCPNNLLFKSVSFISLFQKFDVLFWTSIKLLMKYRVGFWSLVSCHKERGNWTHTGNFIWISNFGCIVILFFHQPMSIHFGTRNIFQNVMQNQNYKGKQHACLQVKVSRRAVRMGKNSACEPPGRHSEKKAHVSAKRIL